MANTLSGSCLFWTNTAYAPVLACGQGGYDADQAWFTNNCSFPTGVVGRSWGQVWSLYK